ncbi:MAG: flagellar FlbD family protein [Coprobacillaceae bacterium]
MISISKLNGKQIVLNCELIETIEALPDTTITMTNGRKFITTDSVDDVIDKIIKYKNKIFTKYQ